MENAEVKKHVAAIHISNKLTLLQHKIANVLLLFAYDDLLTKEVHTIKINSLARLAGFDSNDYDTLKKALSALAETTLQWNILDSVGKNDQWGISTMLAQAVIERGECRYAYSPELRKKLYNPEVYARINILIQRTFSSGYALKLYENCLRYRGVGSTGWWPIDVFRSLLGLSKDEYRDFKDLNKWVIKPSIIQVNKHSDIFIEVEYQKEKRRIIALRFHIKSNPQLTLQLSIRNQLLSSEPLLDTSKPSSELDKTATEKLKAFGLTEKQAHKAVVKYGNDYIMANLDIVEKDYQAGKVNTLAAYTKAALKEDYRMKPSYYEAAGQPECATNVYANARQQQAQDTLNSLYEDFRRCRLQKILDELPVQEYEALKTRFQESQRSNPVFKKWFKQGYEHPAIQGLFRAFASQELGGESSNAEFAEFVYSRGYDLETLRRHTESAAS